MTIEKDGIIWHWCERCRMRVSQTHECRYNRPEADEDSI